MKASRTGHAVLLFLAIGLIPGLGGPAEAGINISIEKLVNGDPADFPPGPSVPVGSPVTFTYDVAWLDSVSFLNSVVITDNNATPGTTADDFNPAFVGGDGNGNGHLDFGETWEYTASSIALLGLHTNLATVTATANFSSGFQFQPTGSDAGNYTGVAQAPEPSSALLLVTGLAALGYGRRLRRRQR
jgi:hypothetical protein